MLRMDKSLSTVYVNLTRISLTILITLSLYGQKIPILMYHCITHQLDRFSVTPENFRRHLEQLYALGYVSVRLEDVVLNKESVRDKKGVILRFDDSTQDHFNYIQDDRGNWIIDPKCAVGILLDFYKKHPKFGKNAIFCVIAKKEFGQPEFCKQKLEFLLSQGMEIVNHGMYHEYITTYTSADIDRNFGQAMSYWESILGEQVKDIRFVATPYGSRAKNRQARARLKEFCWQNKVYPMLGTLYVDNSLCPLPMNKEFNPYNLGSLTVTDQTASFVLDILKAHMLSLVQAERK